MHRRSIMDREISTTLEDIQRKLKVMEQTRTILRYSDYEATATSPPNGENRQDQPLALRSNSEERWAVAEGTRGVLIAATLIPIK